MSFWMENAQGGKHALLDVGYLNDPDARERFERVIEVIGRTHKKKKNGEIAGFGRLLIRVPDKHLDTLLEKYPEIHPEGGYCWTTHSWLPPGASDLKFAWK